MEKKVFKFEIKGISEDGEFDGYLSTFNNIDHGKDIVERGAFKKTISEKKDFPLLWYHFPYEPVGMFTVKGEDEVGLAVHGILDLNVQRARELYSLIKKFGDKVIQGMSMGYDVIKEIWEKDIRRIKELKLWEGSLVVFPMNPRATITNIKAFEDDLVKVIDFASQEEKAGRKISSSNLKLIKQAIEALNALLEAAEPSDDTQGDKKSQDNPDKPVNVDHLLDSTIEELKKLKSFRKEE